MSQFDKDDVEAVGLVKFDFLGPDDADDPRLDAALRAQARSRRRRRRSRRCRSTTRRAYDIFRKRQHHRRVPVRIARHARPAEAGAADALRGHHRAGRAVPARADGADSRLHRAQERAASASSIVDPRLEPILGADVRRDGVPGAGDADRAGDRRLHARRRRPAAPRDGQEEARGDGEAARHLRRRRREERPAAAEGDAALRPDGEVRRLRLQQVARRRVRARSPTRPRTSRRIIRRRSWRPTCRW